MSVLANALKELYGLLVEDQFVAIGALIAIGIAYALSRESALGEGVAVGAILFALLVASLAASLARAAQLNNRRED